MNKKVDTKPLKVSKDSESIYINGAIGGTSLSDIRLLLLENKVITDDEGKIMNQDVSNYQLVMSPRIAAEIIVTLEKQIEEYNFLVLKEQKELEKQNNEYST